MPVGEFDGGDHAQHRAYGEKELHVGVRGRDQVSVDLNGGSEARTVVDLEVMVQAHTES